MKKFFEKYDLFKIASIFVIVSVILTWIFKYSYFTAGELTTDEINRIGIFDLSTYSLLGLYYFTVSLVFILVVAGFYKVISSVAAYQSLTSSIAQKFNGKEKLFVAISILFYAVLSSIVSDQLVLFAFVPFSISIMNKLKLDKVTALSATIGGVLVGIVGSTYSSKIVGYLVDSSVGVGVSYGYEIVGVLVLFAIAYLLLTYFTFLRINKNNKDVVKDIFASNKETKAIKNSSEPIEVTVEKAEVSRNYDKKFIKKGNKKSKKALLAKEVEVKSVKVNKINVIPMVIILLVLAVLIILAFINWESALKVSLFTDLHKQIVEATVFDIPIFKYILGNYFNAFGSWDLFGASSLLLIFLAIIKIVYRIKLDTVIEKFGAGIKTIGKTVVLMLVVYLVLEINVIYPTIPAIVKAIIGLGNNFATRFFAGAFTALFTVDFQYIMSMIGSYFATFKDPNISALALQTAYGLVSFVAPTSLILMTGLSMFDIKYKDWIKHIWKFALVLLVVILVILAILNFI